MPSTFADPEPTAGALAAAIARHPASGPPRFRGLVRLLTGDWRVADPEGFAATLTGAPELAGHPVFDLVSGGDTAAGPAPSGPLCDALVGAAQRSGLDVRWVSGSHSGTLFVEARAQVAAGPEGPELFVLAHLVERLGPGGRRERGRSDHSWAVLVVGDGAGGVAGILRGTLSCPSPVRGCRPLAAWARWPLSALREALLAPALEAAGMSGHTVGAEAVVIPFRVKRP